MTFDEWLSYGQEKRWIEEGVCSTHDLIPMSPAEEADFEDGGDPCVPVLRVWTERI